ncbi:MAG: pseudouridine synthase [Lutibacter sp.]|uniref:pseudouridine synthase n=1 Tax=Lutibacter sp. TaxID=1925666 RepID=UPI00385984BA
MENTNHQKQHQHFIIFKPHGYLSQFVNNQTKRKNKKMLGELFNFPKNTMAIGRLDETSEGLLLLTTNGKTSEFIRSTKIEKEYYAQVDGKITSEAIKNLKNGVEISTETGKYFTKNCIVKKLSGIPKLPERAKKIRDERHGPTSWISITLREGKFRQVRKMTAVVGFPTLRLVRIRIGNIQLSTMQPGDVIETTSLI